MGTVITFPSDNVVGTKNVPVHIKATITSDIGVKNVEWSATPQVNFSVSLDKRTLNFTPSVDGVYKFTCTVQNNDGTFTSKDVTVTVGAGVPPTPTTCPPGQHLENGVCVPDVVTPPPEPVPTPAGVIYDSNIDGKWNNGVKRTVTDKEGNIGPNGKGFWCAASGNPTLIIDGDGVAHLKGGSGGVDNLSLRLRSRHQEGGDCVNRFGGFGSSIDKTSNGTKTESCHNLHENSVEKAHGLNVYDNNWHHVKFEVKDESSSKVLINQWIDGKQTLAASHGSPKPYYMDKTAFAKSSYIWIRINNSDHPRIYIAVLNYNAVMDLDFKFEPSNSAVALKNVRVTAL